MQTPSPPIPPQQPRLLERLSQVIRLRHYSYRTEQSYVFWIRRFVLFHDKRHPGQLAEPEVSRFLTHLAVQQNVAPSTQNQCMNALIFLYKQVLGVELNQTINAERA